MTTPAAPHAASPHGAAWTAEVFQNEYLPEGASDVHAIVTIGCSGAAGVAVGSDAAEVIIVDRSGSMNSRGRMQAAIHAAQAAITALSDGTWFAVVAGHFQADLVYPANGMVQANEQTRYAASRAVGQLVAHGGTAMGAWLQAAHALLGPAPVQRRHAILLTDGKNESERPGGLQEAIALCTGKFQCDCRGVGADWDVSEVRSIATALLGTVGLIADPADLAADFTQMMQASMARGVSDAKLKVWAPRGAQLLFVRQVAPTIEELTDRRVQVSELVTEYPTGAWGDESRDYHVAVRVAPRPVGAEQLAARVQVEVGGQTVTQGLVKAQWSDDHARTARIDAAVAHYTGQTELASAIQDGLAAKEAGDDATATAKLGRAVQLAAATGDKDATSRLRKVVDIDDPDRGTVRLKREVNRLDELELDTASTKTVRVRPAT